MASVEFKEPVPGETVVKSKAVYAIKAGPSDFDLFLCLRGTTKSVRFTLTAPICIPSKLHEAREFEALIQDLNPLSNPENYPRTHEWEVVGLVLGPSGDETTHFRAEYDSGTRKGSLEFLRSVPQEPILGKSAKEQVEYIRQNLSALAKQHRSGGDRPNPSLILERMNESVRHDVLINCRTLVTHCRSYGLSEKEAEEYIAVAIHSLISARKDSSPQQTNAPPCGMYSKT